MTTSPSEMVNNTPPAESVTGVPNNASTWLSVYAKSSEILVSIYKSGVKLTQSEYYIRFSDSGGEVVEMLNLFDESTIPIEERPVFSNPDYAQLAFDDIWDVVNEFENTEYDSIEPFIVANGLDGFFEF